MSAKDIREVAYGTSTIAFAVNRKDRRTLAIHVHPGGSVEVDAPLNAPDSRIDALVCKRARWIQKQERTFAELPHIQTEKQFVSGEAFRYLGRQYRLKVLQAECKSIRIMSGYIVVAVPDTKDKASIRNLVLAWYAERARCLLPERLAICAESARRHRLPSPSALTIRRMKKRWGSCSKAGRISISPEIVCAARDCIDYVLLHELCHLAEANHGPRFFQLLAKLCPDWKKQKNALEKAGASWMWV